MIQSTSIRGYTLLEMIVAVGIFSVVMLAATGAYLTLINLDRQARAMNDVVSNLTFAVDSMSRAVRTGTGYKCDNSSGTPNCINGSSNSTLGFTDSESPNRGIVYSLSGGQIMASICSPAPCAGGTASALTDPRITVQSLKFYVRGVGVGDGIQPQVTFTIAGLITTGVGKTVNFSIEGGATQRLLDI
jgi:prepilin-type N-terminal cleavage/methylation domain-containing protein